MRRLFLLAGALLGVMLAALGPGLIAQSPPRHVDGKLPNGANYVFDVPEAWNGTLLLFSHGYGGGPSAPAPNAAGRSVAPLLLARGYALAGSSYSKGDWSVAEGLVDQIATIDVFKERYGAPKRTIAWGESMGALLTVGLIERHPDRFDGALALCGSVAGVVGMLNIGLDGAFAVKSLLGPDSGLQLVNIGDEQANNQIARQLIERAQGTPEGRARLALAAALGQVALWGRDKPEAPAADYAAQAANQAKSLPGAVFTPRRPLEARAGGNFSWNVGVDYRRQLSQSGRLEAVASLYKAAGLDLDRDLKTLNETPRIGADPSAVAYMKANLVPSGNIADPLMTLSSPGDDLTSFAHEQGLAAVVRAAGKQDLLRQAHVNRAGHCVFSNAELVAALQTVDARIATGRWNTTGAATLNAEAAKLGLDEAKFVEATPPPFLRPCTAREKACPGER